MRKTHRSLSFTEKLVHFSPKPYILLLKWSDVLINEFLVVSKDLCNGKIITRNHVLLKEDHEPPYHDISIQFTMPETSRPVWDGGYIVVVVGHHANITGTLVPSHWGWEKWALNPHL